MLTVYQTATQAVREIGSAIKTLNEPGDSAEDKTAILLKKYAELQYMINDLAPLVKPFTAAETLDAYRVNPPADVFYHLNRYVTNHYEELRDATRILYNEKPDIEYSIIYYDQFKSKEDADDYRVKHEADFKAEVITVGNNGVSLLGPFKENRDRVDFYNKNTEILKRMMEQMEQDHKLGKDLMEKQLKIKKARNIMQEGPDAPGLAAYSKALTTIESLGAKKVLSKDEQQELVSANKEKEMFEVPDDAI
jgi:hypothetical protein